MLQAACRLKPSVIATLASTDLFFSKMVMSACGLHRFASIAAKWPAAPPPIMAMRKGEVIWGCFLLAGF